MSLPIILRRDARAEFDAAFDWYESQRPGLGLDFAARIQEAFARIADRPELFGIVAHDVRRALVGPALPVRDHLPSRIRQNPHRGCISHQS